MTDWVQDDVNDVFNTALTQSKNLKDVRFASSHLSRSSVLFGCDLTGSSFRGPYTFGEKQTNAPVNRGLLQVELKKAMTVYHREEVDTLFAFTSDHADRFKRDNDGQDIASGTITFRLHDNKRAPTIIVAYLQQLITMLLTGRANLVPAQARREL